MFKKPSAPVKPPSVPTRASFVSRGTAGRSISPQFSGPNFNPVTGSSKSNVGRPSLLGGA